MVRQERGASGRLRCSNSALGGLPDARYRSPGGGVDRAGRAAAPPWSPRPDAGHPCGPVAAAAGAGATGRQRRHLRFGDPTAPAPRAAARRPARLQRYDHRVDRAAGATLALVEPGGLRLARALARLGPGVWLAQGAGDPPRPPHASAHTPRRPSTPAALPGSGLAPSPGPP